MMMQEEYNKIKMEMIHQLDGLKVNAPEEIPQQIEMIDTSKKEGYENFDTVRYFINKVQDIYKDIEARLDKWTTEVSKKFKGVLHYKDAYKAELKNTFTQF